MALIQLKHSKNGAVVGMWYRVLRVLKGDGLVQISLPSGTAVISVTDIKSIDMNRS